MVVDDIAEAIIWRVGRGRPHDKIVRVQVFEEVDSAAVEVVIAPHLDELSTRVNAHLLVPVALHDNLLWLVAQLVQEHGLDDAIVDEYLGVASALLVVLGHACVVSPKLLLRGLRAEENTVQGSLLDGLQATICGNIPMICTRKTIKYNQNRTF